MKLSVLTEPIRGQNLMFDNVCYPHFLQPKTKHGDVITLRLVLLICL